MSSVVLYHNHRTICLTMGVYGCPDWNLPMDQSSFVVYTGIVNKVEFSIKTNDRKPVDLTGFQVLVTISDWQTRKQLYVAPATVECCNAGRAFVTLSDSVTSVWPIGYLRYTVVLQDSCGTQSMLWVDQDQGGVGYLELREGPALVPFAPCFFDTFTPEEFSYPPLTQYVTSAVLGNIQSGNYTCDKNLTVSTTNFTGTVKVQASLAVSAPMSEQEWFDVPVSGFNPTVLQSVTGNTVLNIMVNSRWLRFVYYADPLNQGCLNSMTYTI